MKQMNKKLSYTTNFHYYRWNSENPEKSREKFLHTFKKVLEERIPEDLNVEIDEIQYKISDRIFVRLIGTNKDDLKFVSNILREITGKIYDSQNVPKNRTLHGILKSVGKIGFGVFVDVGIESPSKEVLIPLHKLRSQLVNDKKLSLNEIINLYGFMDFLPVEIEVTKIQNEKGGKIQFEGQFTDNFLTQLEEWIDSGLDIIFTTGIARQLIKRTIAKRGHSIDIIQIDRLGPLETAIICKEDTNGPGIISHIGPFLPNCRFSTLRSKKLQKFWNQK
ncbi:MAG: DUF2110 family protein [Promethearchaeota archaeon]